MWAESLMCYLFIYFYLYLTRRFTKKPSQDSSHDANMLKMHQLQQKIQDLQNTNTHNKTHQRPHKKNIHISFTALLMMLFSSAEGMLNVFKLRSFCFSEELTRAEKSMEVNVAVFQLQSYSSPSSSHLSKTVWIHHVCTEQTHTSIIHHHMKG